jgi:hypothetical protein
MASWVLWQHNTRDAKLRLPRRVTVKRRTTDRRRVLMRLAVS